VSRPLLALPATASWGALGGRLALVDRVAATESFDVLARTEAVPDALHTALARGEIVRALVLAAPVLPEDTTLIERFAALARPTLALFGTHDARVPPQSARRWRALVPSCHIVFLYDAGHDLAADRPEAFADAVTDFLADPGTFLINRRAGALHP